MTRKQKLQSRRNAKSLEAAKVQQMIDPLKPFNAGNTRIVTDFKRIK